MWDFLVKNKIKALANNNNKEEAILLQKGLVEKAAHSPEQLKKRYAELSRLHWSFNDKAGAIAAAEKAGSQGLIKFYRDGNNSLLQAQVDKHYSDLKARGEYVSQLWMGLDYAYAGAREKALECFNNAIALREASVTLLLIRDYEFLNIKYLSMALVTRKVKHLVNF